MEGLRTGIDAVFGGEKPNGPAADLVDKATADSLVGPDWGIIIATCDLINTNVPEHGKDAAKALRKRLTTGSAKGQLLSLTVLEACVKNCGRRFHEIVAQKECLQAMSKLVTTRRTDPEVRDKAAALIREWADAIALAPYKDTYADLSSRGVDFPAYDAALAAPIHTPPPTAAPVSSAHPFGGGGDDAISDADAAAIAEAISQAEEELRAEQRGAAGGFGPPASQPHPIPGAPPSQRGSNWRLGGGGGGGGGGAYASPPRGGASSPVAPSPWSILSPPDRQAGASSPPRGAAQAQGYVPPGETRPPAQQPPPFDVAAASACAEVLSDVLACADPQRPGETADDEMTVMLARRCAADSHRVAELLQSTDDADVINAALQLNDELLRALTAYEALVKASAAAGGGGGGGAASSPPSNFAPFPPALVQQQYAGGGGAGFGSQHAVSGRAAAASSAGSSPRSPTGAAPPLPPKPPGSAGAAEEAARAEMRARARSAARVRGAALLAEAGMRIAPPPPSRSRADVLSSNGGSPVSVGGGGLLQSASSRGGDLLAIGSPSGARAVDLLSQLDAPQPQAPQQAQQAQQAQAQALQLGAPPPQPPASLGYAPQSIPVPPGFSAPASFTNPSFDGFGASQAAAAAAAVAHDAHAGGGGFGTAHGASPPSALPSFPAQLPPIPGSTSSLSADMQALAVGMQAPPQPRAATQPHDPFANLAPITPDPPKSTNPFM